MFCGTYAATTSSSFLASSKPYKKWENLLKKILRLVVVIYSSRERFSIECRKQSGNYFGFGFTSVCDWLSSPTGQLLVWGLVLQHSTENHSRDFYISWIKPLLGLFICVIVIVKVKGNRRFDVWCALWDAHWAGVAHQVIRAWAWSGSLHYFYFHGASLATDFMFVESGFTCDGLVTHPRREGGDGPICLILQRLW